MEIHEYRVVNNFKTISTQGTLISCSIACAGFCCYVDIVVSGEKDFCRFLKRIKRRVK